jgi:hypothetical protein
MLARMVGCYVRTGVIPAIFAHLKDKKEPVPLKVAAVELIKSMQADEDEATADAITAAVDRYPEVCDEHSTAPSPGGVCLASAISFADCLF